MRKTQLYNALAMSLGSVLLCVGLAANAGGAADAPAKPAQKKPSKAAAPTKPVTSKFVSGSEESAGQRNARLKRECKGAVNAGACAGYTR